MNVCADDGMCRHVYSSNSTAMMVIAEYNNKIIMMKNESPTDSLLPMDTVLDSIDRSQYAFENGNYCH